MTNKFNKGDKVRAKAGAKSRYGEQVGMYNANELTLVRVVFAGED